MHDVRRLTRCNGAPSLKLYFAVIDAIERTLDRAEQRYNLVGKIARKRLR